MNCSQIIVSFSLIFNYLIYIPYVSKIAQTILKFLLKHELLSRDGILVKVTFNTAFTNTRQWLTCLLSLIPWGHIGPQQHSSREHGFGMSSLALPMSFRRPSPPRRHSFAKMFWLAHFQFSLWIPVRSLLGDICCWLSSVWPINHHFLFFIFVCIGACLVLSHKPSFETLSGHLMLRIFRRHLLVKVWSLWVFVYVIRHVSEP